VKKVRLLQLQHGLVVQAIEVVREGGVQERDGG